jgi:hypothetical protein
MSGAYASRNVYLYILSFICGSLYTYGLDLFAQGAGQVKIDLYAQVFIFLLLPALMYKWVSVEPKAGKDFFKWVTGLS